MIGIFWVYQNVVFGQAEPITAGTEAVVGLVDSNLAHVELWDKMPSVKCCFPELTNMEYQDVARGRVLWQRKGECHRVYLDKSLLNPVNKASIAQFFGFDVAHALWKADSHYTTDRDELDMLFKD